MTSTPTSKELSMQKLSISLSDQDLAAIDRIAAQFVMARRHAVARAALRAGVDQMVRDVGFASEHLRREAAGEEISYEGPSPSAAGDRRLP